jgi:bacterioferritin-associated ferredoxin
MIICVCLALSDRAIRSALAEGARSLDDLAVACRAGTACGTCLPALQRMIGGAARPDAVASHTGPRQGEEACAATNGSLKRSTTC